MEVKQDFIQFSFKIQEQNVRLISENLPEEVDGFWWDETHAYGIVKKNQELRIAPILSQLFKIQNISFEPIDQKDWLKENQNHLPPIETGPFFIYGPHFEGKIPEGKLPLKIDSPHAFGSGHHPTTLSCLEALLLLNHRPNSILDLGCGSGILAMAAHLLWKTSTDAMDIDPLAIKATKKNLIENKLEQIFVYEGSHFIRNYELILANLHSNILISLADEMKHHLLNKGMVILSGILKSQTKEVLEAYAKWELNPFITIQKEEWATLVLC